MKRPLVLSLLLLFALPIAGGNFVTTVSYAPSVYLSIPHFEDELPFRTSMSNTFIFEPFGYEAETWSVNASLKGAFVTPSLGDLYRAWGSLPRSVPFSYSLTPLRPVRQWRDSGQPYTAIEWAFLSFWAEAGSHDFETTNTELSAILPIMIDLRKEITALSIGLGLRWSFVLRRRLVMNNVIFLLLLLLALRAGSRPAASREGLYVFIGLITGTRRSRILLMNMALLPLKGTSTCPS